MNMHGFLAGLLLICTGTTCYGAGKMLWTQDDSELAGLQMVIQDYGYAFVTTFQQKAPAVCPLGIFNSIGNYTAPPAAWYWQPGWVILEPAATISSFVATNKYTKGTDEHIVYTELSLDRIMSSINYIVPVGSAPANTAVAGGVLAAMVNPPADRTHLFWAYGSVNLQPITAHPNVMGVTWDMLAIGPNRDNFLFAQSNVTFCLYDFNTDVQTLIPVAAGWNSLGNSIGSHNKRFVVGDSMAIHVEPIVASPQTQSNRWSIQRMKLHTDSPQSLQNTLHLTAAGYYPNPTPGQEIILSTDLTLSADDSTLYMRTLVTCDRTPMGGDCYGTETPQHLRVTVIDTATLESIGTDSLNVLNFSTSYPADPFLLADGGIGMVMFSQAEAGVGDMTAQLYTFKLGRLNAVPGVVDLGYTGKYATETDPLHLPSAVRVLKIAKGTVQIAVGGNGGSPWRGFVQLLEFNY